MPHYKHYRSRHPRLLAPFRHEVRRLKVPNQRPEASVAHLGIGAPAPAAQHVVLRHQSRALDRGHIRRHAHGRGGGISDVELHLGGGLGGFEGRAPGSGAQGDGRCHGGALGRGDVLVVAGSEGLELLLGKFGGDRRPGRSGEAFDDDGARGGTGSAVWCHGCLGGVLPIIAFLPVLPILPGHLLIAVLQRCLGSSRHGSGGGRLLGRIAPSPPPGGLHRASRTVRHAVIKSRHARSRRIRAQQVRDHRLRSSHMMRGGRMGAFRRLGLLDVLELRTYRDAVPVGIVILQQRVGRRRPVHVLVLGWRRGGIAVGRIAGIGSGMGALRGPSLRRILGAWSMRLWVRGVRMMRILRGMIAGIGVGISAGGGGGA
mmetsp:Transcript_6961/g.17209  ORF Transcript_6961/g.17209 Transcript_6961/m.17209 type:complete len:372 (-) Transcript_6961:865-1980(-)